MIYKLDADENPVLATDNVYATHENQLNKEDEEVTELQRKLQQQQYATQGIQSEDIAGKLQITAGDS